MSKFIASQTGDLWSVANSQQILCYLVPRSDAAALLTAEGENPDAVLVQAPAAQWFPTILAALESTTDKVETAVVQFSEQYQADELHERIDDLHLLLAKVVNDTSAIVAEIERQAVEREQQRAEQEHQQALANARAEQDAIIAPVIAEQRQLASELQELESYLERESRRLSVRISDLSGTHQFKRANAIKKRLAELRAA